MLDFGENYKKLANILSKCEKVTRYDCAEDKEAWTLAHAFLDLDEEFRKFSEKLLPKLQNESLSEKEIHNALIDIGESFRHILYHIKENKYYEYLQESEDGRKGQSPKWGHGK